MDIFGVNPMDFLDFRLLALIISCSGAALYIWFMANSRFPKVQFLTFRGDYVEKQARRRMGDKVVPDSLIMLLLRGDKILGTDIHSYKQIQMFNGRNFQIAYLAENVNGELLPLKKEMGEVNMIELTTGQELATAYVNVVEKSEQQLEKLNPIMAAIYSSLPLVILMLAFGLVLYINVGVMTDAVKNVQAAEAKNLDVLHQISDTLMGHQTPPTSPITQNQTISNGGATYGR